MNHLPWGWGFFFQEQGRGWANFYFRVLPPLQNEVVLIQKICEVLHGPFLQPFGEARQNVPMLEKIAQGNERDSTMRRGEARSRKISALKKGRTLKKKSSMHFLSENLFQRHHCTLYKWTRLTTDKKISTILQDFSNNGLLNGLFRVLYKVPDENHARLFLSSTTPPSCPAMVKTKNERKYVQKRTNQRFSHELCESYNFFSSVFF